MDVPRVVPCMPGAELTDTVDDSNWQARMSVKLGPISMTFAADVHREEVDEAARRAVLVASARELRGRGRARIESSLEDDGSAPTVRIVTDLSLSGAVAQYGGRGMVQAVSAQLIDAFAACLRDRLEPSPAPRGDEAAAGPDFAETGPVEAVSAFALARVGDGVPALLEDAFTDTYASGDYRRHLPRVMTRRALQRAFAGG